MDVVIWVGPPTGGTAIFPAWPISCWSNSVALRILLCIAVRFATVPCVVVICIIAAITIPATLKRMKSVIIISSMENPSCRLIHTRFPVFSLGDMRPPQNGHDFNETSVDWGRAPCGAPTWRRTLAVTVICLKLGTDAPLTTQVDEPAGFEICQTRM